MEILKAAIRDVPDFPKPGIVFKDITTLLQKPDLWKKTMDAMAAHYQGQQIDYVVGAESRGFIFGATLAYLLDAGFVPVRKPGKLPAATISASYALEYGTDTLEMHQDAFTAGSRVLLCDDLLATGGTMEACARMVEQLGGVVAGCCFVIELAFLKGREKLAKYDIFSLISYPGE